MLVGGFSVGIWGLELEIAVLPYAKADAGPGQGAEFTTFYGGAAACVIPIRFTRENRLQAAICAGAQIGFTHARGFGFDVDRTQIGEMINGVLRGKLAWRVTDLLSLWLRSGLALPFVAARFDFITPEGERVSAYRMEPVGGLFDLGLSFNW